jgi:hypothetical protein
MQLDLLDNGWMDMSCSTIILYSLCSIKHVAKMDVSGHILVSRYIHIIDMFYGTEGVPHRQSI